MSSQFSLMEDGKTIRLNFDISPETDALLESLANSIGGTKSEVLRKGIVLLQVAIDAKRQGKKIGIAEKDQVLATEIVGICSNST